jgi:hypothetical protein
MSREPKTGSTGEPIVTCPNCGSHEADDDGDCTVCREPGIVAVGPDTLCPICHGRGFIDRPGAPVALRRMRCSCRKGAT